MDLYRTTLMPSSCHPSAQLRVYTGGDYKVYDQGGVIYSLDEIVVTGNKQ